MTDIPVAIDQLLEGDRPGRLRGSLHGTRLELAVLPRLEGQ